MSSSYGRRRMSLPQTPQSTPLLGGPQTFVFTSPMIYSPKREKRILPLRPNRSLTSLTMTGHTFNGRLSQPDLSFGTETVFEDKGFVPSAVYPKPRYAPNRAPPSNIQRRFLRRANQSDLAVRLQNQREREMHTSNESTPSREMSDPVDPVYLALKQATGKYGGRRGSSAQNFDSATPSPRNLSQVSLQDSGYAEMTSKDPMLGSTPQLENAGRSTGRRRAPRLSTQMKSLSLDCQDMPPRIQAAATRSPLRSKLTPRENRVKNSGSDLSDWERSCSPCTVNSRRSSTTVGSQSGHIVIHEYCPPNSGKLLLLGDRVRVVDNGDPDWLHGFRINDRTEHLLTFPATCVAAVFPGEQAMRILQNVVVPETKLRMYRDQIVFAQPDTLVEGKVTVRTAHNAYAPCHLTSLTLI